MTARIGAFALKRRLGRGGMGEVWKATHVDAGVDVALKIMTGTRATDPHYRAAFGREVRAVASLDHPAIVRVFDCGEIAEQSIDEAAQLAAESPYLVMEIAVGTLRDLRGQLIRWSQWRTILLRILDGLNHAHVRGVIHRDIKPENVLIVSDDDGPSLKLADFGLAHAYRRPEESDEASRRITGTPRFMAPEQILGMSRDQGPWTDLYSVGCLAYWLIDGRPPYSGAETKEILEQHLGESPPRLDTAHDLPEGFEAWLDRMMAKRPRERFRLAADAAMALRALANGDQSSPPAPPPIAAPKKEALLSADTLMASETVTLPEQDADSPLSGGQWIDGDVPPVPARWERAGSAAIGPSEDRLRGVGLGLYGLRQLPLVDRVETRDRLWAALRETHATNTPRAIALTGTMGVGKTRLARWLAERALEVGAALTAEVRHSPIEANARGLAHLLARLLRCHEMATEAIFDRLKDHYAASGELSAEDRNDCAALTELVAPICDRDYKPAATGSQLSSPRERYAVVARFLSRINDGRPLVLVLDDVQWGHDTLRFIEYLVTTADKPPAVLAVMTVRDENLKTRHLEREVLERLDKSPHFDSLDIAPLSEHDHRRLVSTLLGLESDLYEEVVERTRGNPLFAIQLVGDWVERGVLVATNRGFRRQKNADARLPDDIQQLLEQRLHELAQNLVSDKIELSSVWASLELAAALGREVELREWHRACNNASIPIASGLVEALSRTRLAEAEPRRFIFSHGAIRECLEYHARADGRWREHHRICARALREIYPPATPGLANRVGHHFVCAERWKEAVDPLLAGADEARINSDFPRVYELLDLFRSAVDNADLDNADDLKALGEIRRARTLVKQARLSDAAELLDGFGDIDLAPEIDAERLFALGILARSRGDVRNGIDIADRCLNAFAELVDTSPNDAHLLQGYVKSIGLYADILASAGQFDDALAVSRNYFDQCRRADYANEIAAAFMQQGNIYALTGQLTRSLEFLTRARRAFAEIPNRYGVAQAENAIGEVHRMKGATDLALDHYQNALDLLLRIGVPRLGTVRFNIALCLVDEGNFEEAGRYFDMVYRTLIESQSSGYLGLVHLGIAACAGAGDDWTRCEEHFAEARQLLDETGFAHTDVATLACTIADIADSTDNDDWADRARELAAEQYDQLDQPQKAKALCNA